MNPAGASSSRSGGRARAWSRAGRLLLFTALFTTVAIWLQWRGGVYRAELDGYPDEAAHLITGLMVRDYAVSGFGKSPVEFAENYYLHYPKVGFGIWPPLYHFVEAAWFLVTPPGKTSAFILQALITGSLAACVAAMALPYGILIALAAGLALVGMPTVQSFTGMVMADNLMCLIAFLAMVAFTKYSLGWQRRYLYLFGLLAGLALMTKSNAAGLALLPVVALILLRRTKLIFSWPMIGAAIVSLAVALPWQILVMRMWSSATSANKYLFDYVMRMLQVHASMYFNMPGMVVFALAMIGFIYEVVIPYYRGAVEARWAALSGLVLGMFLFGLAPLPPEPRYHVASMAGLCVFAAAALYRIGQRLEVRWGHWASVALVLVAAAGYAMTTISIPQREPMGYGEAARSLAGRPEFRDAVILVSSENMGEGMFISEMAPLELRPSHYILRATKMLSRSRWNLDKYELFYQDARQMQDFFESIPVRLLVYDRSRGEVRMPHHDVIEAMLKEYPDKWRKLGAYPAAGPNRLGSRIEVYELQGVAGKPTKQIHIDLRYTLQRVIQ